MVRRAIFIGSICLIAAAWVGAHTVYTTRITWSRDVSRIFYRHCASCHRPGGAAFSMLTYKDSRPWAEAIKEQVLERRMPPWNAVKGFGEFKDDAGLPQEDLEIIGEWVDGGVPEGNSAYLPPPPEFGANPQEKDKHVSEHRLTVLGTKVMTRKTEAIGIEPAVVPDAGVVQVIAHRPDGEIEPLIWIEKFNPNFTQTYYFREPLHFPAGTRIEVTPRAGSVALVVK